ncbi:MAG: pentapeptide repeat-containing protein, partial [Holosporaceae bacterium]
RNKATSTDIAETKARFEGVPPEELERFLNQLSTLQRFGLRMMLQQGKLPHSQRIETGWDQPAFQSVPAAELLDIPKLLTDPAAVEQYLSDHHIGVAEGDHSQHQDRNGGKALPPTFRGALIRDFNGNGRTMPKDLRGTWWNNATAIGADFQGADLSDAILIDVDLSKANLSDVNLSGARLVNCNLAEANLSGAIMDCTWIENCTITDSVMHGGVIQDVVVTASYINNLTLHGTDENPMIIKGVHLSESVVLDCVLGGNCHVQQIEVYSSAVVGQSNGHVPPEELDYCSLSYYADQPPLRGLSNLILPPNAMVARQIDCDRQVAQGAGAIGSSLVLTVVDGNGRLLGDVPLLEHLAGVQIGYQSPQANRQPPLSSNPQLPPERQHVSDVDAKHAAAPFQAFSQGATR